MLGWKVAPALAAGNALVIKPSEESTLSALYFARLAIEAGVPEGIVNVISGQGAVTGQALGLHNDVDALTFTGSGPTGRRFLNYSAESNLKAVSLELGGRAGYLVDAEHARDFDMIASDIIGAAFGTSRSEEHTSELQPRGHLVCRLLLEKKNDDAHSILQNITHDHTHE